MSKRAVRRFLDDCRDLWRLITGQGERPLPNLSPPEPEPPNWAKWEADKFKECPWAFWYDPGRYDGTEFAYERYQEPERQQTKNYDPNWANSHYALQQMYIDQYSQMNAIQAGGLLYYSTQIANQNAFGGSRQSHVEILRSLGIVA